MKRNKLSLVIISILVLILSIVGLSLFVKGNVGGAYQYDYSTAVGGPFESSNTTSRYMLTEVMAKEHTYYFNEQQAHFSAPDVVYYKNKFFSIFTPGISYLAVPLYLVGDMVGLPQLFAFFTTLIFAVLNVFLVARLASKFGANSYLGYALGLTFLFGTNALAYSLTLTQHHYSVSVLLLAILNALEERRTVWNNIAFGLIFTAGILFDVPNAFMMTPLAIFVAAKHFEVTSREKILKVFINPLGVLVVLGMIPLLSLFAYYNLHTSGAPTLIGQNLGQSDYFDPPAKKQQKILNDLKEVSSSVKTPFNTRKQLSGFYVLLFSDERGIFYYDLVVLCGIIGLLLSYRSRKTLVSLVSSVILVNIVLYSAFGDAWGGWSFGPRYLIPTVALLLASAGSLATIKMRMWKYVFATLFVVTLLYSVYINTMGALTTNAIPPKVEALALPQPLPYTYKYNFDLAQENKSSSLLYNATFKNSISLSTYHLVIYVSLAAIISALFGFGISRKEKKS